MSPRTRFRSRPRQTPSPLGPVTSIQAESIVTAAIHYVLRKQLSSLESQRDAGLIVVELLELYINLLRLVKDVSPARPSRKQLDGWFKAPFTTKIFSHGLDAIT